jgi:hypothetical protein
MTTLRQVDERSVAGPARALPNSGGDQSWGVVVSRRCARIARRTSSGCARTAAESAVI